MFFYRINVVLLMGVLLAGAAGCSQKNTNINSKNYKNIPKHYTVQSGDSVSKIAKKYGLDWRSISQLNRLDSNHTIYTGQKLKLKGAILSTHKSKVQPIVQPIIVQKSTPQPTKQPTPVVVQNTPSYTPPAKANQNINAPLVGSSAVMKFAYPVGRNNPVVKNFASPTQNGPTEGIFFSGREGDRVVASLDGVVIGTESAGNGRAYVLLEHNNGYQSAYFDLKNISVRTGQSITKNTPIGQMQAQTQSGLALFEFRVARQGRYIDPVSVLR